MQNQGLYLHRTATGDYWLPESRTDHVLHMMMAGETFDLQVVEEMKAVTGPGSVIVDAGSNFGQMAVLMSKHVGPDGQVIACEADPWISWVLRMNLDENRCFNTRVVNAALWDSDGEILVYPEADFVRFESYGSYGIDPTANDGRRVMSLTIDTLDLPRVDLIKIDVQGSDLRAMKGAINTIKRLAPTIIFEYESLFDQQFSTSWHDYATFIDEIGYKITKTIGGVNHVIVPR